MLNCGQTTPAHWSSVLLSLASVFCQMICLNHLKSTAVIREEMPVVLGFARESDLEAQHKIEHMENLDASAPGLMQSMMRIRFFERARAAWSARMKRLRKGFENYFIGKSKRTMTESEQAFDALLGLFLVHEDQDANANANANANVNGAPPSFMPSAGSSTPRDSAGDVAEDDAEGAQENSRGASAVQTLQSLYQRSPEEIEALVPQLCIFLIFGSFGGTDRLLKEAMLDMCSSTQVFAHKMYWFCSAFFIMDESQQRISTHGREALKQLVAEVEAHGDTAARRLSYAKRKSTGRSAADVSDRHSDEYPLARVLSQSQSNAHGGAAALSLSSSSSSSAAALSSSVLESAFHKTITFWDRMCCLCATLAQHPKEIRNEMLRSKLPECVDGLLPSSSIYAPLGNAMHRCAKVYDVEHASCVVMT